MISRELDDAGSQQKPLGLSFLALKDNCLTQDRHRDLKLVRSELSDHKVSNMSLQFVGMSVNKSATENIRALHKKSM
jgi:hypothetical protein